MQWSDLVRATLRTPGPMSPVRIAETSTNDLAADAVCCDLLANVHSHVEHGVDLKRVVEVRDLRFSEF